ncbi:MAG: hypothetical protein M3N38_11920 [Pseudomonadota bacterium]|nr:hypothetical protein [Pseudomonadota bacterium]
MLRVAYDPLLVIASVFVAVMAAFTGLRLTSGLELQGPRERKRSIAQAAVALGGGIWSMHFVGMLAVTFPIAIGYAALATLAVPSLRTPDLPVPGGNGQTAPCLLLPDPTRETALA